MKLILLNYNHVLAEKVFNYNIWILIVFLGVNTKEIIKGFKNIEDLFDFSNLTENIEPFSNKNKKLIRKLKIDSPEKFYVDKFVALRSKFYAFKCEDICKNKNEGNSKY